MAIQRDERQILTQPSNRLVREFKTNLPSPDMTGAATFAKVLGDIGEQGMKQAAQTETEQYFQSLEWGKDENGNFVKPQAPEGFGSFRREYFNELVNKRYTTEVLLDHDTAVTKIYADTKAAGGDPGVAFAKAEADMKGRLAGVDPSVRSTVELGMRKTLTQINTNAVSEFSGRALRAEAIGHTEQITALSDRYVRSVTSGNTADAGLARTELEARRELLKNAGLLTRDPAADKLFWNSLDVQSNVKRALSAAVNDPKLDPAAHPNEMNRLQRIIMGDAADNETAFGFKKSDFDNVSKEALTTMYQDLTRNITDFKQQYAVSARMQKVQNYLNAVDIGNKRQTFGMSDDDVIVAFNQDISNLNASRAKTGLDPISPTSPEGMRYLVDRHGFLPSKMYDSVMSNIATRTPQEIEVAANLYKTAKNLPDANGANAINVTDQIITDKDAAFLERYISSRNSATDPANAVKLAQEGLRQAEERIASGKIEADVMAKYKDATGKSQATLEDFHKHVAKKADLEWTQMPMTARLSFMRSVQEKIMLTGSYETGVQLAAQSFKKEFTIDPMSPLNRFAIHKDAAYVPKSEAFPIPLDGKGEPVAGWANGYVGAIVSKYANQGVGKDGKPIEGTISIAGIPDPVSINSLSVGKNVFFQNTRRGGYDSAVPWYKQDNVDPSFQMVYYDTATGAGPAIIHVKGTTMPLEVYPHKEAKAQHEKFVEASIANNTRLNQIDANSRILSREFPGISFMSRATADMKVPPVVGIQNVQQPIKPTLYGPMGTPTIEYQLDDLGQRVFTGVELFRAPDPDAMISKNVRDTIGKTAPGRQSSLGTTGIIALGTNDGTPDAAYKGAIQAIDTAMAKGIDPVIVLPNPTEGNQFKPISDAVRRAAEEKGVRFEVLAYAPNDPLHVDPKAAKELASKYPNAVYFGDSNAVRIANSAGIQATNRAISMNGTVVAREGIGSADISKLISGYSGGGQQQTGNMAADAKSILDFVARPESGGNYNAILGNAKNQTIKLTDMTLTEVTAFQRDMVTKQGKESGAVGKYQIIGPTLQGLIKKMNLDPATTKFTPELQDRMAMQLLEETGYKDWKGGIIDDAQFANRIAKVWAGVPVVSGAKAGSSYYAGVGSNKAGVSSAAFLNAIKSARGAG